MVVPILCTYFLVLKSLAATKEESQLSEFCCELTQYFKLVNRLVIADELDYLITKDRAVLHDLFMLTTMPYSRCILLGMLNRP